MKSWSCYKENPRDPSISPCGYDKNETDPACKGCADNPAEQRREAREREGDEQQRRVRESWAARWKIE